MDELDENFETPELDDVAGNADDLAMPDTLLTPEGDNFDLDSVLDGTTELSQTAPTDEVIDFTAELPDSAPVEELGDFVVDLSEPTPVEEVNDLASEVSDPVLSDVPQEETPVKNLEDFSANPTDDSLFTENAINMAEISMGEPDTSWMADEESDPMDIQTESADAAAEAADAQNFTPIQNEAEGVFDASSNFVQWYDGSVHEEMFEISKTNLPSEVTGNAYNNIIHINVGYDTYGWLVEFGEGTVMSLEDVRKYQLKNGTLPADNGVVRYGQNRCSFSGIGRILIYKSVRYFSYIGA